MELTLEQALQRGIAAHKEGKLQEAERFYRAILQSQPTHPDASHNLGLIAVSLNKADTALPLFKTAIEANPKVEQFWLSYIDTLVKDAQLRVAEQSIKTAKKEGFDTKNLEALLTHSKVKIDTKVPSREQLNSLLEHYQDGRYGDAEKYALSITQKFPEHQFGWKVLGAVLKKTGRISESLIPSQRAVSLSFQDAEAHNNLGTTLQELDRLEEAEASFAQAVVLKPDYAEALYNLGTALEELGRLVEAEASYRQAIALKPDFAEPHYNLGVTLHELGRLEEAEASYRQAMVLKPDFVQAHYNLGYTLQTLGRLEEAEVSYRQALTLKPDYAEVHSNLGVTLKALRRLDEAEASHRQALGLKPDHAEAHNNLAVTLQELGRLDEAEASYRQAIALKPDFAEAMMNLSINLSYMEASQAEIRTLKNVLQIDNNSHGLIAGVNLAICNFLSGCFSESKQYLLAANKIHERVSTKYHSQKVYQRYLLDVIKWRENNDFDSYAIKTDKNLYIVGDSHSLVSHHLRINSSGIDFFGTARLIRGCKQWHLGNPLENQYKYQFERVFFALPKSSEVLLAVGEIDCRLDSGIIEHKKKNSDKEIKEIITTTVKNYLTYIFKNNSMCRHKIFIQGVPCPNIDVSKVAEKDFIQLINVINRFNCELKAQSKKKGFGFLDVHKLTNNGDGLSNGIWHIDNYHLTPDGMLEAWRSHIC